MLTFGARNEGNWFGGFFDGKLDDIYIYDEALSSQQIAAMAGYATFDMTDTAIVVTESPTTMSTSHMMLVAILVLCDRSGIRPPWLRTLA